jgi:sensor histidine kinase YesM
MEEGDGMHHETAWFKAITRRKPLGMGTKVFLLTFTVAIMVILILGSVTYQTWMNSFVRIQMQNAADNTARSKQDLETRVRSIQVQMAMLAENIAKSDDIEASAELLFSQFIDYYSPFVKGVYVLNEDGSVIGEPAGIFQIYGRLIDRSMYLKWGETALGFAWSPPYVSPLFGNTITGIRKIQGSGSLLAIDLNLESMLNAIMEYEKIKGYLFLTDRNGKLISANRDDGLVRFNIADKSYKVSESLEGLFSDTEWSRNEYTDKSGNRYFLFRSWSSIFDNYVIMAVHESNITGTLHELRNYFVLMGIVAFFLCLGIAYTVTRNLARPILFLIRRMNAEDGQMFAIPNYLNRNDEIGHLIHTYNSMIRRISTQMTQIVELEAAKRATELRALQAQIQPHFLYNTLNAIKSKANINKIPDVAHAVANLITLLRYTVNNMDEMVTVEQELHHAKAYTDLMRFQYRELESIEWEIDPRILADKLPKLSLQPLIENSIFHGILPGNRAGVIRIEGTLSGTMAAISVIDNGVGIPEELFDTLCDESGGVKAEEDRIGLVNVQKRLKLHFAKQSAEAGLCVRSVPGEGTEATIYVPHAADKQHNAN